MSFQMPPRPKFSTDDSVKIVGWWYELKDIHKVRWRYAKDKGIEHFPRKLPSRKAFRCVIWFQQDGARCHTSNLSLEWLREKFGNQIISGNTEIPWPARSPDEAPCDFYLWSICEAEIRRVKPRTLEDLMEVVNTFVASLDEAEVRRAVRDVRPRAELCVKMGGGHFKSKLKKYKRGSI